MTRTVFDRRRAERFAQLIAEDGGAPRHHSRSDVDMELAPLVEITRRVTAIPVSAEPDPEFRVGLRAMLTARIEREGIGATAVEPRGVPAAVVAPGPGVTPKPVTTRRGRTRVAIFAGVTAGALALSGVSAASGDAVPGDTLYSVKRSTERAQLALASSDITRGQLYLQFAQVRLAEARRSSAQFLPDILLDMNAETRLGMKLLGTAAIDRRDPAALDTIDAFVATQRRPLLELADRAGGMRRDEVLTAVAILDSVAARSQALRGAVRCGGSAGIDELGPRPRPCVASGVHEGRPHSTTGPGGAAQPEVIASGGQSGATAPVPSPATPQTTSGSPEPTAEAPTGTAATDEAGKKSKDKDDSVLDRLGRLFGSLLGR
ncbi:DUF5667 domain-containing protein [Luedemannella helvata]|uniref:DUF5667 domain-containing protein n=1 Tax=Luedemannella helvata TaxID=349315 RepID=A0ABP4WW82_9ACTN